VRVNCWNKLSDVAAQYVRWECGRKQVMAEWLRPSAWVDQSGTPQPSLDINANLLVLLDRLTEGQIENSDNGHSEEPSDIPF